MAVESPLMSSPSGKGLVPTFSAIPNASSSPRPSQKSTSSQNSMMSSSHEAESCLYAQSPDPSNNGSSETFIDPSPIAPSSNGTEFADLDEVVDNQATQTAESTNAALRHNWGPDLSELKIRTSVPSRLTPSRPRSDEDEPPKSVIHAPAGFSEFNKNANIPTDRSSPSPSLRSDRTVKSPLAPGTGEAAKPSAEPVSPPPLTTSIQPAKPWSEGATPRAQTRSEFEPVDKKAPGRDLEDIPEGPQDPATGQDYGEDELDAIQQTIGRFQDTQEEITALRSALAECWTLCNTLANLSYIHRERIFTFSGKGDLQENAWKSCWRLCQKLYDSRDEDATSYARSTLDLCRDFCQALFEVRARENEGADSVLRVSFELNNHLYNTHDRTLPEAFRERTLDFYITLCHRLMKQKCRMAEETDSLLRACWSLAEMLFSIRQSKMESRDPDEELLGSAVQACWELCDLFREGWTQIRPDRGTPRPSQTTFTQAFQQAKQYHLASGAGSSAHRGFPETPTTIFEDTVIVSPDEAPAPNILVIDTAPQPRQAQPSQAKRPNLQHNKWSSASSTLSGSSHQSSHTTATTSTTSSAHTITSPISRSRSQPHQTLFTKPEAHMNPSMVIAAAAATEDPNFHLLRLLFIKAAQNSGFKRAGPVTLSAFVRSLPADSFGHLTWQMNLLENYKKAVAADETAFRDAEPSMRAAAVNVARAVRIMIRGAGPATSSSSSSSSTAVGAGGGGAGSANGGASAGALTGCHFAWLRDLFRLVFGFHVEQAASRKAVVVQT